MLHNIDIAGAYMNLLFSLILGRIKSFAYNGYETSTLFHYNGNIQNKYSCYHVHFFLSPWILQFPLLGNIWALGTCIFYISMWD
ncbi:unnamed protein product [Linum trigynum]|uniref:Uncharacterized protein n=1 Tax=Linum trigynum TaxID=586398 RepID=A0AAV2C862_9ROSI